MIDSSVRIVPPLRRGAQHHIPIKTWWRVLIWRVAKARHCVAKIAVLDGHDLSKFTIPDKLSGTRELRTGTVLCSDLNYSFVALCHVDHPTAFLYKKCQWFLHVNVLAGSASHH